MVSGEAFIRSGIVYFGGRPLGFFRRDMDYTPCIAWDWEKRLLS